MDVYTVCVRAIRGSHWPFVFRFLAVDVDRLFEESTNPGNGKVGMGAGHSIRARPGPAAILFYCERADGLKDAAKYSNHFAEYRCRAACGDGTAGSGGAAVWTIVVLGFHRDWRISGGDGAGQ